ncbi:hypothetical protein Tco_0843846 [Tanacetum coccineum]
MLAFEWRIPMLIPFELEGEALEPEGRVRHQAPQANVMYTSMDTLLLTPYHNIIEARLGRHPINVRTFPDPILFQDFLKPSWEHGQQRPANFIEMAFRNFMYVEDDKDLSFLPCEPSLGFKQLVENTADSRGSPAREGMLVIGASSVAG